ncbi:tartrate dehydrogenase [Capillimicrobium parvum]|uniref:D-malate dehydrogenase (decarboxylating) n=1 Tax=Capillimicrobium parvum TaxID=2884022 RepID=A0A9E6Y7K4_9ACTN|nr:tartrate dehydrogenase [Capillimicrobium parvum]UGS39127.1 putative tartrate dehydrogenase/decarboxylase TtuC' [Capillimicrobium parvum]
MRELNIAVIPGDGIGPEVIPQAVAALEAAAASHGGLRIAAESFPWGSEHYLEHGHVMPDDGPERLAGFDAILAGPVGDPRIPDTVTVWGLILALRQAFDQYVNLRPAQLLTGVRGPLADVPPESVDMVFVRENTEGEYGGAGGRVHRDRPAEVAVETSVFTRSGIERIVRYAFEHARAAGRRRVTSATKSNALRHAMPLWDEVFAEVAADYADIEHDSCLIDALVARMVSRPDSLDVVVASNLFGDILTDLGAAIAGSMGLAPSANLDPTRRSPSLFQAIHGSAPDIAGRGIANPIAEIWSAAMLLEFAGEQEAGAALMEAVRETVADPARRTTDLGGSASTAEVGTAVCAAVAARATA